MVDVTDKDGTVRVAKAAASVRMSAKTAGLIRTGGIRKGDVLAVAQVAGIMAAKRTFELIPMCHPIALTSADVSFEVTADSVEITSEVKCKGETGVEMEALSAVTAAALTVYDMCKAVERGMTIEGVRLLEKSGGRSGLWRR